MRRYSGALGLFAYHPGGRHRTRKISPDLFFINIFFLHCIALVVSIFRQFMACYYSEQNGTNQVQSMTRSSDDDADSNQNGYVQFPYLAGDAVRNGKLALNRYSSHITNKHDFPPAKVCFTMAMFSTMLDNSLGYAVCSWSAG